MCVPATVLYAIVVLIRELERQNGNSLSGNTNWLEVISIALDRMKNPRITLGRLTRLRYVLAFGPLFRRFNEGVLRRSPGIAVEFYSREIERYQRRYGPDSIQALNSHSNHAVALHGLGEMAAAETELAEVIARFAATGHTEDVHMRSVRAWHARVLADLGRDEDAEREWRWLTETNDRMLGPSHPDSIDAHQNHAVVLYKLDRLEEAMIELEGVINGRTAGVGIDQEALLKARRSRAVLLDALGQFTESEPEWRELAHAFDHLRGDDDQDGLTAHEKHAIALYKLGSLEEAVQEFSSVVTHRKAMLGVNHEDTQRAAAWRDAVVREIGDRRLHRPWRASAKSIPE